MNHRLTQRDGRGNWSLSGMTWDKIQAGKEADKETWEKIYGALCKLKDYEDTGLNPVEVEQMKEEQRKYKWIPVTERVPENDNYILLSFENFILPEIGRYETDEEGGAFYLGDDDESCSKIGLFVNAWMPILKPYKRTKNDRL